METGSSDTISSRQKFAEDLAAGAAEYALGYFRRLETLEVESKNPLDFVSEADRSVERLIRDRIQSAYPGEDIVGEEGGGNESDAFWSLDPIDGTANFLGGIPLWGVSIGFCENGEPTVGAICIPLLDILISADQNLPGIRYNRVQKTEFRQSAIPTIVLMRWNSSSFREVEDTFRGAGLSCMNIRCSVIGSAFAVLGMTQGYYQEQLHMWDVAAAYVLAKNAGLHTRIRRNGFDEKLTFSILSPEVHKRLGDALSKREPEHVVS